MTAVLRREVATLRPVDPPLRDEHVVVLRQRDVLAGIPEPLILHRDVVGGGRHRKITAPSLWAIVGMLLGLLVTVSAAWCRQHREQLAGWADDLDLIVTVLWLLSLAALLAYAGWRSA